MSENKDDGKTAHANSVIKNHMIWSMGAGFIPIPIADFFAVSAIQLDMIRQMCKIYDIDFKETEGKAMITALTSAGLARLGARAVKFIPGIGSILGGVTLAVLSGGSTYALGEVFKEHFATGGTFLDFDPNRLKKYYDEKFEKGKNMARQMEQTQKDKIVESVKKMEHEIQDIADVSNIAEPISDNEVKVETKGPKSLVDQLESITKMREDGFLTKKEFDELKKKIMEQLND